MLKHRIFAKVAEKYRQFEKTFQTPLRHNFVSKKCEQIVENEWFQRLILFTILATSSLVGIQTDDYLSAKYAGTWDQLDNFITAIFTSELIFKLAAVMYSPQRFFFSSNPTVEVDWWNIFDLTVVVLCFCQFQQVSVLRLMRLCRVFKLIKAIPALKVILEGLLSSVKSIVYIFLLLLIVFYIFAILGMDLFNDPMHFGTLLSTIVGLFTITTGASWTAVMYPLIFRCETKVYPECLSRDFFSSTLSILYFVMFVFLSNMVVLNLVIGVITQSMEAVRLQQKLETTAKNDQIYEQMLAEQRKNKAATPNRQSKLKRATKFLRQLTGLDDSAKVHELKNRIAPLEQEKRTMERTFALLIDNLTVASKLVNQLHTKRIQASTFALNAALHPNRPPHHHEDIAKWDSRLLTALLKQLGFDSVPSPTVHLATWKERYLHAVALFAKINSNKYVQGFFLCVVMIASILLGFRSDVTLSGLDGLSTIDRAVSVLFVLEIILKLAALGDRLWVFLFPSFFPLRFDIANALDVLVVVSSFQQSSIIVLRLFRLLRVVKLIRAVPTLKMLMVGMLKSLSSMIYVGALMLLIMYIFGVLGNLLFQSNDPVHFGDLGLSILSLLQCATGDNWDTIFYVNYLGCKDPYNSYPPALCKGDPPPSIITALYFMLYLVLTFMIVLNLIIGVIIGSMSEVTEEMDPDLKPVPFEEDFIFNAKSITEEMSQILTRCNDEIVSHLRGHGIHPVAPIRGDKAQFVLAADEVVLKKKLSMKSFQSGSEQQSFSAKARIEKSPVMDCAEQFVSLVETGSCGSRKCREEVRRAVQFVASFLEGRQDSDRLSVLTMSDDLTAAGAVQSHSKFAAHLSTASTRTRMGGDLSVSSKPPKARPALGSVELDSIDGRNELESPPLLKFGNTFGSFPLFDFSANLLSSPQGTPKSVELEDAGGGNILLNDRDPGSRRSGPPQPVGSKDVYLNVKKKAVENARTFPQNRQSGMEPRPEKVELLILGSDLGDEPRRQGVPTRDNQKSENREVSRRNADGAGGRRELRGEATLKDNSEMVGEEMSESDWAWDEERRREHPHRFRSQGGFESNYVQDRSPAQQKWHNSGYATQDESHHRRERKGESGYATSEDRIHRPSFSGANRPHSSKPAPRAHHGHAMDVIRPEIAPKLDRHVDDSDEPFFDEEPRQRQRRDNPPDNGHRQQATRQDFTSDSAARGQSQAARSNNVTSVRPRAARTDYASDSHDLRARGRYNNEQLQDPGHRDDRNSRNESRPPRPPTNYATDTDSRPRVRPPQTDYASDYNSRMRTGQKPRPFSEDPRAKLSISDSAPPPPRRNEMYGGGVSDEPSPARLAGGVGSVDTGGRGRAAATVFNVMIAEEEGDEEVLERTRIRMEEEERRHRKEVELRQLQARRQASSSQDSTPQPPVPSKPSPAIIWHNPKVQKGRNEEVQSSVSSSTPRESWADEEDGTLFAVPSNIRRREPSRPKIVPPLRIDAIASKRRPVLPPQKSSVLNRNCVDMSLLTMVST